MRYVKGKVYHAARGFLHHLLEELPPCAEADGELVRLFREEPGSCPDSDRPVFWTRNVWEEPFVLEFGSISEAAKALKSMQRNWAACPTRLFRRTELLRKNLPPVSPKPRAFPFDVPTAPMGAFTLLDEHKLLGSARCSNPFPNGEFEFIEDREGPPSRAYRKLWEALLFTRGRPGPGATCLDAGASPGGWTWALASLGADVLSVDRAPLDPAISALPKVRFLRHDAFTLKPSELGPVDWLFSDVICYPEALLDWIQRWLDSGLARNFVCTIKLQGAATDRRTIERFASIPGSRVMHLWHNRHELTWMLETESPGEPSEP